MQLRILAFTFAVLLSAPFAFAGTLAPGGGSPTGVLDANSNVGTTLATTLAGEDVLNDVQKVESRFSNLPTGATTSKMSADTAIKNAPGFLKRMTCWSDAVATAGNIKLLDNTAAGAGNALLDFDVLAVAYLPFTIEFDVPFSVGLYFDVTTTADLFCQVSYR